MLHAFDLGPSSAINSRMLIAEITNSLPLFYATVRAKTSSTTMTLKTAIYAEGPTQARQLLMAIYGEDSVVSLAITESEGGTKTLSAQELQVKSLSDKAKQFAQQAKATKARQQVAKAQQALQKANTVKTTSVGA